MEFTTIGGRPWAASGLSASTEIGRAESQSLREVKWRCVVESIPHIVWMAAPDGAIEYFNRWGVEYTGFTPETNQGWAGVWLVHPDDAAGAKRAWDLAAATGAPYGAEYRIRRADGQFRWHVCQATPLADDDGRIERWIGTAIDIEDHKGLAENLQRSERQTAETITLLEALQTTAPVGFGFVDRDYRYVRVNETLASINGLSVERHLGRTVAEVDPRVWPRIEPVYRRVLDAGEAVINLEMTGHTATAPGQLRHWLITMYPICIDAEITGAGVVVVDITERRQAEEFRSVVMDNMAEGLCTLDGDGQLTSMNRAATKMLGWTEAELRGQPLHAAVHFQRADGTALSADECSVVKARVEGHSARQTSEAFTRKDGSIFPVAYSSAPLRVGSGIQGAVVVFRDLTEERQDQARVQRELAALSWVGRVRDALDEHRLVLYSQPIVALGAGHHSEELLLRMVGRGGEIILPGSFLPVAEKYGLIAEIDRWVTLQAVNLAATGRRVEANLSAASIGTLDLLPLLAHQLDQTGADPANLIFEITETTLMDDIDAGAAFAHGLADLGCQLALDDFGTGFGSFTYLKKLPINYLKIDIEFIRDLPTNQANLHVVRAIVGLARAFGLQTIAEGVQNEQTLTLLRHEGVDYAQGFHLGRPAPIVAQQKAAAALKPIAPR